MDSAARDHGAVAADDERVELVVAGDAGGASLTGVFVRKDSAASVVRWGPAGRARHTRASQAPSANRLSAPKDTPVSRHHNNKKHLENVGPIRHCEPPHAHSPGVATVARCLRIDVHDNDDDDNNNDNDNA